MIVGDSRGEVCTLRDTMRPRVRVLWWSVARELIALWVRVQGLSTLRINMPTSRGGFPASTVIIRGLPALRVRV